MIARHEAQLDKMDIWAKLAAALPQGVISWRQDGRPIQRDGRFFARFVSYVEANTVRERLDAVVPGEWDLTLELLPPTPAEVEDEPPVISFKARLQVLGVIREDVGQGRDYKQAATDAFKRAAVRFGIAHELYAMEQNWVQVDGDGKYAKPLEDPQTAYDRRYGGQGARQATNAPEAGSRPSSAASSAAPAAAAPSSASREPARKPREEMSEEERYGSQLARPGQPHGEHEAPTQQAEERACPKCGGRTWDNRASKRNPRAPDFKCRDRGCDGVIWPPRPDEQPGAQRQPRRGPTGGKVSEALEPIGGEDFPDVLRTETDDLPF